MGINLLQRTQLLHAIVNTAAGGTLVFSAAAPQTFGRIYRVLLGIAGSNTLTFQDTGGNPISGPFGFSGGGGLTLDQTISGDPWFQATATGLGLQLVMASATQVSGDIWYLQGP
jgi:hypothetical protein